MKNEKDNVSKADESSQDVKVDTTIEFMGQSFDVSTEAGRAGYNAARTVFEKTFGKQSNELGEARKELTHLKQYAQKVTGPSKEELNRKVAELYEEGRIQEAFELTMSYADAIEQKNQSEKAANEWFENYYSSRQQSLSHVPKDMVKSYLFSNESQLINSEDAVVAADALLEGLMKSAPKADPSEEVYGGVSTNASSSAEVDSKKEEEEESSGAWDQLLNEFNFE